MTSGTRYGGSVAIITLAIGASPCSAGGPAYDADGNCFRYEVVAEITGGGSCGFGEWGVAPLDMNEAGVVVGYTGCWVDHAFVWHGGPEPPQLIPMPPGTTESRATAINDLGQIVGYFVNSSYAPRVAFHYDGETLTMLPPLPGDEKATATGINDAGDIVGYSGVRHAVLWRDGEVIDLSPMVGDPTYGYASDINDSGQIAGYVGAIALDHSAFIIDGDQAIIFGPIEGGSTSAAYAINDLGVIAGAGRVVVDDDGNTNFRACRSVDTTMANLGTIPPYEQSRAYDINDDGQIVGWCAWAPFPTPEHGVTWINGQIYDLNELVTPRYRSIIFSSGAVNDSGLIVAPSLARAIIVAPTYEVAGDLTDDCIINAEDLILLLSAWGTDLPAGDLVQNGVIDVDDLLEMLARWDI